MSFQIQIGNDRIQIADDKAYQVVNQKRSN